MQSAIATGMVTYNDIADAAARLAPFINRTPLIESATINEELGGRLFLKAECLQKTGSFKFRGATNRIQQLTEAQKKSGVVAYSSGNHAQGIALAAKLAGVPAAIVMPKDAPQMKIANTERHGARVVLYDRYTESREDIGASIAEESGAVLVPPFDDPHIIAGQGTVGIEAISQAKTYAIEFDDFIGCISGGGLTGGWAIAFEELSPKTQIWTAEPEDFDDVKRSLEVGERLRNEPGARSICDALLLPTPGELTFPILKAHSAKGLSVSDQDVMSAMRVAYEEYKLVLEPGGAVALACVLSGKIDITNKTVGVICTGGNVDLDIFKRAIS